MNTAIAVELRGVTKRFLGSVALRDVNLTIAAGSCHGLVGENGAGKSTLGKILAGIHQADAGQIRLFGQPCRFRHPAEALAAGVALVHQELAFCENMTVAENLLLGRLPARGLWLSMQQLKDAAQQLLADIAPDMDITQRLGELPVSQQQLVQIATAVGRGARLIIFDEPTSSLSEQEALRLHQLIRRLQAQGVTCLYISHRLSEVFALCDTISVLRDGELVCSAPCAALDADTVIRHMIGRPLAEYFPKHIQQAPGEVLLAVEHLRSPGKFSDVSFQVRRGEIVGLAGLVGAGRTELAEALFGLDPHARGRIFLLGQRLSRLRPARLIASGLGLLPEDRKRHGLVGEMSIADNLTLPILPRLAIWGWLKRAQQYKLAQHYIDQLRIRAPSVLTAVATLSGGNQQKVMLARWLAAHCPVLILDEPTRGVDVGAKAEIHAWIDEWAARGFGILLISSELPELLNLSTRLLIMREGRLVGELPREELNQERVLRLMTGAEEFPSCK